MSDHKTNVDFGVTNKEMFSSQKIITMESAHNEDWLYMTVHTLVEILQLKSTVSYQQAIMQCILER